MVSTRPESDPSTKQLPDPSCTMVAVKSSDPPTGTDWEAAESCNVTSLAEQSLTLLTFFGAGVASREIAYTSSW